MKRSLFTLALFAVAGSYSAQTFAAPNITGAVATLLSGNAQYPGGVAGSTPFFFAGNTTEGFVAGRNGFSGFAVLATAGTPLEMLGLTAEKSFNKTYDALLPTYIVIDKFAKPLAAPGAALTQPVAAIIVKGANTVSVALIGNGAAAATPGLPGLAGLKMR
ncbi:hypothetical protein [uncultured Nevskia sp.]|uniref:hypothetical protein n=1 Tax=uncultured Nevskia sp. TaxID=228950 RepID=UPI0025D0E6C5|nr:hypothetical protein [uncultured Nevskia sp.]